MLKFAKLFDVADTQVLVYAEYETKNDETIIHQMTTVKGLSVDMCIPLKGEDQEERAARYVERFEQSNAERIHAHCVEIIPG